MLQAMSQTKTKKQATGGGLCAIFDSDESSTRSFTKLKSLYLQRRVVVILAVVFSITGIILGITSTEISVLRFTTQAGGKIDIDALNREDQFVTYVRYGISCSTVLLILMITYDFFLRRKIQVIEKNLKRFIYAITFKHLASLLLEIAICAIHPLPLDYANFWAVPSKNSVTARKESPVEVILNMLMFLRIYLVARVILLFSPFKRDSTAHSIAKINRVKLDYIFVFKSFMNLYPTQILIGCASVTFLWAAWAVRVCEMNNSSSGLRESYLKNLWFIGVTFLTVGYGDVVPDTICGKTIAIGTGEFCNIMQVADTCCV
ncbi:potassium intermediate small conductance calcium-activated channel, subfamily N, member 3 [Cichlidogyrus casuarinus]|uniref:Potassium intermediate small conductance calcium-activated channel, subfamily N, member 3 n=1 Tax=Cichlidogyrus casuarinus TaxID=1844966 RepID=A0ABD2Q970_9PLAT